MAMIKLFAKKQSQKALDLLNDPLSIEMIAKIAKDCGRHFEIVRQDGTIFRFYKDENKIEQGAPGW